MKKLIIALIALGAAFWVFQAFWPMNKNVIGASFVATDGTTIEVVFDNSADTATMSGVGYEELVFNRAISASGARYKNSEVGLVLWNKGDEITLYDSNNEPIFTGIDSNSLKSELTFESPEKVGTGYVSTVDWPPVLNVYDTSYTCTEAGEAIARAGKTERVYVNGSEYCKTTLLEGAAGSTYGQYAYAFEREGKTLIFTFSLRYVQCLNYDEPKQSACKLEQESLNVDALVDGMAKSVKGF